MHLTRFISARAVVLLASVAVIGSCGLPRSGPLKREIYAGSVERRGDAYIVPVSAEISRITDSQPEMGFSPNFLNAGVMGADIISAGDLLTVTVFENVKDDPLLGNTDQRVSVLTEVQVDGQGYIFIPYAGRILAAGQTPEGVRQAITRQLEDQTPDPQITVSRVAGNGATVSVSGSAAASGIFPIEPATRTLSRMIAQAGGVTIDPDITIIRVTRGGETGEVWLNDLNENPELDIALRPGDKIIIQKDRRSFTALGATGSQSLVPFRYGTTSALEAIAMVGGISSWSANPKGVFILRDETEEIARAVLGRDDLVGPQRVVYVLNLIKPNGLFEARDFHIRDGDTLYVTEAPFTRWQNLIGAITGTAGAVSNLATTAETLN